METKEELEEIIKDLKSKLDETIKKLKNFGILDKWRPQGGDTYYYIDSNVELNSGYCYQDDSDNTFLETKIKNFNCFKTKEEAEKEANKILIRRKLEDLARRLNEDKEINWNNSNQIKYHIMYNFERRYLDYAINYKYKDEGCIYCLNNNFLKEAIKEIGEEQLIDYIKGE